MSRKIDTTLLSSELSKVLMAFFSHNRAAARKIIVETLRSTSPELDLPQLDLVVAEALNCLVENGTLQRVGTGAIRFYAPGKRYEIET